MENYYGIVEIIDKINSSTGVELYETTLIACCSFWLVYYLIVYENKHSFERNNITNNTLIDRCHKVIILSSKIADPWQDVDELAYSNRVTQSVITTLLITAHCNLFILATKHEITVIIYLLREIIS